ADFAASLEDRLHQPYRAGLVPGLAEILALREPGLLGCVLSGAGPSVLVFFEEGAHQCCERVRDTFRTCGQAAEIIHVGIASEGYELLSWCYEKHRAAGSPRRVGRFRQDTLPGKQEPGRVPELSGGRQSYGRKLL